MMKETSYTAWDDRSELEQLEIIYCEMHKDVYGVKARWYRAESVEQARADVASLQVALEAELEREQKAEQEAIAAFQDLVAAHGGDTEAVKRWQHQAYNTDGRDDFLEYEMGLPFGYFKSIGA